MFFQVLYANDSVNTKKQQETNKANPYNIDYKNLDSKYYPFIKLSNKFYDKDIIETIQSVDKAQKKNAFFVGMLYGFNINIFMPLFGYLDITKTTSIKYIVNYNLFGLRAGYQKYTSNVFPVNSFGYQIYIDYNVSFGRYGLFFTGINTDMLWDFLEYDKFIGSLNIGLGLGFTKIAGLATNFDSYEVGYKINMGISVRYITHHKIGLYFGNTQGLQRGFIGSAITIGYDYVF